MADQAYYISTMHDGKEHVIARKDGGHEFPSIEAAVEFGKSLPLLEKQPWGVWCGPELVFDSSTGL